MLRLDFLAQVTVPYAGSSFVIRSDQALMESPFWNRPDPVFSKNTHLDLVAAEHHRLLQLVSAHNKRTKIVWGCWFPVNEWASRERLIAFYDELCLWKATSPATFTPYDPSSELEHFEQNLHASSGDSTLISTFPEPQPYFFASNEAALNAAMCNIYLASAASGIATTDETPFERKMEVFDLIYQNLRIAAGLIERHKYWAKAQTPYKPCDAVSMGITTFLFQGAQRCFSRVWQKWTIDALRSIGREGLSNGHTSANAIEILMRLEAEMDGSLKMEDDYLGSGIERLIPLLMPNDGSDFHEAFYLKHGEGSIQVVARASWRQESNGDMHSLKMEKNYKIGENGNQQLQDLDLFRSWRFEVEDGWHGFLSKRSNMDM